jgi:hypothetical protein
MTTVPGFVANCRNHDSSVTATRDGANTCQQRRDRGDQLRLAASTPTATPSPVRVVASIDQR